MTTRTMERAAPTEFEIETRGMAKAVDILFANEHREAAKVLLVEVLKRMVYARDPNMLSDIVAREVADAISLH